MEVFFRLRYQTEIKFYISNESLEKLLVTARSAT